MTTELEKRASKYCDNLGVAGSDNPLIVRLATDAYMAGAKSERERCLKAVAEEPEMPGPMPAVMWAQIKTLVLQNDQDGLGECLRILVRLTKSEIQKRIVIGDE